MKPVPYCVSEIIDKVFQTAALVSEDAFIHKKILTKVLTVLQENAEEESPVELELACLRATYTALGVKDPYENEKARQIRSLRGLENAFRAYIDNAEHRLSAAVRLSLASCGDSIKGLGREDLEKVILSRLEEKPAIDDTERLLAQVEHATSIVYVAGEAAELAADRFLLEELAKKAKIEAVVTARAVLSRATAADAEAAGITPETATVCDSGADMLGLIPDRASNSVNEKLAAADLVIVKGAINYQTLAGYERDTFHILRCECPALARELDVTPGTGVIKFRPGVSHDED